jgi:hypothetical protein
MIGALGRITAASALILVAAALTNGATKWVMEPGPSDFGTARR